MQKTIQEIKILIQKNRLEEAIYELVGFSAEYEVDDNSIILGESTPTSKPKRR